MHLHFSRDCSMDSGLCKFCTYLIAYQFSFTEAITNMFGYHRSLTSEQLCHLCLCQPHSLILQPDFKPYGLVWLVEDDFTLFCMLSQFVHSSESLLLFRWKMTEGQVPVTFQRCVALQPMRYLFHICFHIFSFIQTFLCLYFTVSFLMWVPSSVRTM